MHPNDVWNLIAQGKFHDAIELSNRALEKDSVSRTLFLTNRGTAQWALGLTVDALASYSAADERLQADAHVRSRLLSRISACEWLLSNRQIALDHAKEAVDDLVAGKTTQADLAGGASDGLLLYYFSVTMHDVVGMRQALDFLRGLSKRKQRFSHWPGPLASYVLGTVGLESVLVAASGTPSQSEAISRADGDALIRRQVIETLFYVGANFRDRGREDLCQERMVQCAGIRNPLVQPEWYLAKAEAENYGDT